jgi:hypothetical protein
MAKRKYRSMFKTEAPVLRGAASDSLTSDALDYWEIMAEQAIFERIEPEYAVRGVCGCPKAGDAE